VRRLSAVGPACCASNLQAAYARKGSKTASAPDTDADCSSGQERRSLRPAQCHRPPRRSTLAPSMGNWAIGNGHHCHPRGRTPWPSPIAAHRKRRKKKAPSFRLASAVHPLPRLVEKGCPPRLLVCLALTLICRGRLHLRPPRPLPLHLPSPTRTVAWAERAHPQRNPPRNPLPQIVVIPSPLPSPDPSVPRAIWGFGPRRVDGVTGRPSSNMASPSICTPAISILWRPWPTATTRHGGMVRQTWNRRPPPPEA
jgi:hypothetical protein